MAEQARRDRRNIDPEEKQFDEQVVHIDRVARVVKGGRRFHFRALVAVGDHAGNIGIGVSKGVDVTSAVTKSVSVAKKNMVKINLYNETIPHESEAKVGGAHILIKPAAPGTGLKAGGVVRIVLEVAGIRNVLSKSLGSTNKINAAYATLTALRLIEPQENWTSHQNYLESINNKKIAKTDKAAETEATAEPSAAPAEKVKAAKPAKVKSAVPAKKKPAKKAVAKKVAK